MNAILEFTSGFCANKIYCAVASAGAPVGVPAGGRFVCPYCGKTLVDALPKRRVGLRAGMFIGGGMGITGLAMLAIGAVMVNPASSAARNQHQRSTDLPSAAPMTRVVLPPDDAPNSMK